MQSTTTSGPRVWTIADAARQLNVSKQRAHAMVTNGQLATTVVRGRRYVSDDGIQAAMLLRHARRSGTVQ